MAMIIVVDMMLMVVLWWWSYSERGDNGKDDSETTCSGAHGDDIYEDFILIIT